MSSNLYSSMWYRVAGLKPRIRSHAQIHRHEYRGELWYILKQPSSGQYHRFTPAAYHFIGLMDGARTIDEIWQLVSSQLGDDAPTQDETIQFLGQLHAANVLQSDVTPDGEELFQRYEKHQRTKWKQRLMTPLAIRFPLWDPETFLTKTMPAVRPLFGWIGFCLWLLAVSTALVLAGMHWPELTENVGDEIITLNNVLILWMVYPFVKALHELGHAYAVKVWGGEVHEMGIMLLVLMPIPYVEASSATAFQEKRKRIVVSAAGIMVELFLAALALAVWLNVEHGLVRAVAYNVMLIGGISTLFFNGNPLLRFDGYYIMADLIEMPNLASRSKKYLGYLSQRYLFGLKDNKSPAMAKGEKGWFLFYGIASFVYRMFIMFVIIFFIAGELFFLGVLLAIWAVATQMIWPVVKYIDFLFTSPQLRRNRMRAMAITGFGATAILAWLFMLPAPFWTMTEGVVWLPEKAHLRAGSDGFVKRVLAPEGVIVEEGQPLIEGHDPILKTQVTVLEAHLKELDAKLTAQQFSDRARSEMVKMERESVMAELARAREQLESLIIHSPSKGLFVIANAADLPGQFITRGQAVGYVIEDGPTQVRAVVGQSDIGLVREYTRKVDVWLADKELMPVRAEIQREVPGGNNKLPSAVIGSDGGGSFAVNPQDPEKLQALERIFQFDLILPGLSGVEQKGSRVYVRFDHGYKPLAFQWYLQLRQLFLSRFGI